MSDTLDALMDDKAGAAREAWDSGDLPRAEALLLEAWVAVEAQETGPDTEWHQRLSGNLEMFFQRTGQFDKAYDWLDTMRRYHEDGGKPNPHTSFIRATLDHDSGKLDDAYDGFAALYAKFGKRPFADEDPKYLQFYESRR